MTKILVIEDEDMLRDNILAWLTFEGYEAIGAANGVDGVNTAIRLEPDLIVCDIGLPYLDGYGVLLDVRANSTTQLIPFIFLTAKASPDAIRKGMHLGADDYLTKPFARTDLLDAIQTRLRRRAIREDENKRQIEAFKDALSLERSQRLLQFKLVAMFSHDFRTPLSTIMTSTRLLRDYASRMDEARREAQLDRIEVSTHKLIQMLDDMLLVAQIESGKFEFTPEPTDLAEFIQQIVEEYQAVYSMTHQIILETHFVGSALVDQRLVRQIASNLISNAIKYSPQGKEVRISLDSAEDRYVFVVQDQGIGIPEADQDTLFEAFERGSNVGNISGTGLGLATVQQAVEWHKGSLTFSSTEGVGTTFTVTLPHSVPET